MVMQTKTEQMVGANDYSSRERARVLVREKAVICRNRRILETKRRRRRSRCYKNGCEKARALFRPQNSKGWERRLRQKDFMYFGTVASRLETKLRTKAPERIDERRKKQRKQPNHRTSERAKGCRQDEMRRAIAADLEGEGVTRWPRVEHAKRDNQRAN